MVEGEKRYLLLVSDFHMCPVECGKGISGPSPPTHTVSKCKTKKKNTKGKKRKCAEKWGWARDLKISIKKKPGDKA